MVDLYLGAVIILAVAAGAVSAGHALIVKRDPRAALGWITISIAFPVIGPLLYWSMGVNRIRMKARQWHETGRRLTNQEALSLGLPPQPPVILPAAADHLQELRRLCDRVVSTQLLPHNSLYPLYNGEEAYPAMLAAIERAEQSVHLSTYIFDGDVVGRQFVDALIRSAERGVAVRVIIDSLGEKYSRPFARKFFKGSRVKVRQFLPLRRGIYIHLRNHRKILVVDGKLGFAGGMNIGNRHLVEREAPPPVVKDLHFEVRGPVVADLQRTFLEDWYFVSGELVEGGHSLTPGESRGNALARVVSDGPDKELSKLHWIIVGALACARERVDIMTPYFIPDRALISALVTASLRGVAVTLVLPGRNNLPFVHWATRSYLWELLQYGIRVLYQPPPFVHTKMLLVDGIWSLIGSANLDPRSLRLNFELDLEVYDDTLNRTLGSHFERTVALSRQVTLEEMDGRSLPEKLRDGVAKLFSPYL